MVFTNEGRLRPRRVAEGSEQAILNACPGAVAAANTEHTPNTDLVWGGFHRIEKAWAGNTETRHRGATGGC